MKDEAGNSGSKRKVGAPGVLVAGRMALSTVLLFGTALFGRSLQAAAALGISCSTRSAAVVKI